jgi:hypothetical protein
MNCVLTLRLRNRGIFVVFLMSPDAGVPNVGVTNVGLVAKTNAPEPVSSVTAALRLALEGVPSHVATPVPSDVSPVPPLLAASVPAMVIVPDPVIGPPEVVRPVVPPETSTLVTVPEPAGVAQVPSPLQNVLDEADVPEFRFVTGRLPVTPVVRGRPVQFVSVPDAGVPRTGVTKLGDVASATAPEPVVPFERSLAANCETLTAPPSVDCRRT